MKSRRHITDPAIIKPEWLSHALTEIGSSRNVMTHGDAPEGKWMGNWPMQWVASTLHTTSEHVVSSITTADAHTSAASSRPNWRPYWFKCSGYPVPFTLPRNMVYPALLPPMRTPRLPAVDWTDAPTDLNAVGSQYPSHYLGTWCIQHYYRWCAHLGCQ